MSWQRGISSSSNALKVKLRPISGVYVEVYPCISAIRQWDQALRERNDYKDALAKVQRQHEEAVKEVNQAMTVRIKASKDLKR